MLAFSPFSPITQTPTSANSTFKLISAVDGEDVSDFVEVSIWVPDSNAEFDEIEDIYTWSNFEEEESSKDAEDVSIDLSEYEYVWLEIDPDAEQVFQNDHILLTPSGSNFDYAFKINHASSDVNFMCLTNTSATAWENFTVPEYGAAAGVVDPVLAAGFSVPFGYDGIWNSTGEAPSTFPREAVQMNMTLIMDVPEYTHANTHVGTNWNIEQADYDDMSVREMEFVHDEANYRNQAPLYVPTLDLEKTGESGLASITNAFAIRWTYNTTVSTTDGATTMVNMTISDDTKAEIQIDGTYIYMIFYDTIDFEYGSVSVEFEYEEAHRIYATAVQSGRIACPRAGQALGAFTAYSNVGV